MSDTTTHDEAVDTVREFLVRTGEAIDGEPLKWTDWNAIEDAWPDDAGQSRALAEAYATLWRRPGAFDEGEPHPSRYLVEAVESVLGEPVWEMK